MFPSGYQRSQLSGRIWLNPPNRAVSPAFMCGEDAKACQHSADSIAYDVCNITDEQEDDAWESAMRQLATRKRKLTM